MKWEHLVFRITNMGIIIYPPMNFGAELEWIKEAVPYGEIKQEVMGPLTTGGTIAKSHPIQYIHVIGLKGHSGEVGWMIIQELGSFGWEMFGMNGFPYGAHLPLGHDDNMFVYMKRQLG